MNDRIRELAEQAEMSANKGDYVDVKLMMEKFAQLIVRECAEVLDKTIAPPSHPMNSIGWKLKQHFGVKDEIY